MLPLLEVPPSYLKSINCDEIILADHPMGVWQRGGDREGRKRTEWSVLEEFES